MICDKCKGKMILVMNERSGISLIKNMFKCTDCGYEIPYIDFMESMTIISKNMVKNKDRYVN